MNMFRFAQQWINLDHVAHIRARTPRTEVGNSAEGSIEFVFSNGEKLVIEGGWKDISAFSQVFNPLVEALKEKN